MKVFVEAGNHYIDVDHIVWVSAANGTVVHLSGGRRVSVPDLSAEEVVDRIGKAIEVSQL